jgi:glycosyltransferase involved in cell wall biosynthesis
MHGFIPHGRLGQLFERFDIALAPYHPVGVGVAGGSGDTARWMSPLKLFEYMAHSKAIVCSDVPVLREVLQDRVTALLVSPMDIAAWEAAVRALEASPEWRRSLGDEARKILEARYTWDIRARHVLAGLPGFE